MIYLDIIHESTRMANAIPKVMAATIMTVLEARVMPTANDCLAYHPRS